MKSQSCIFFGLVVNSGGKANTNPELLFSVENKVARQASVGQLYLFVINQSEVGNSKALSASLTPVTASAYAFAAR